jgi:nucleoside-diphosphate-sugar epimerase
MNLLLTGGCGYVGTPLTQSLLDAGHTVTVVDLQWFGNHLAAHPNLTVIKEDVRNVDRIPMAGMDVVMHLANVANDPCAELDSKLNWEVNTLATMFLLEKAIANKVPQFIHASSGSVYGVKEEPEVTEELSLVPISDYKIKVNVVRPATVCGYSPRMRLDLSVNMLTMQALMNKRITVFGGDQTRPNIHLKDMIRVYHHFLAVGKQHTGIFNAGFENITILDIAQRVTRHVPAEVIVTPSNDPRSYRLSSKKLLATGFAPKFTVEDGILDVIAAYRDGRLKDNESCYNIKAMKKLSVAA